MIESTNRTFTIKCHATICAGEAVDYNPCMKDDWITSAEAVKLTGYHIEHLRELVRDGKVIARKWGREWMVSRQSLLVYLQSMEARGRRRGPKPQRSD